MDAPTKTPWLASDIKRGYLTIGIALPLAFIFPFAIVLLGGPTDRQSLTIGTLFLTWAAIGVLVTVLTFVVFAGAGAGEFRHWLVATTPRSARSRLIYLANGGGAAGWAVTGSLVAVAAVAILSINRDSVPSPVVVGAGVAVVVASLFMTITAYAVRYAREWATAGGFEFAGSAKPRFADFFYLAVQVATTFGTSDVTVTTTSARRIVTANSLISFAFNTVTVALLVAVLVTNVS